MRTAEDLLASSISLKLFRQLHQPETCRTLSWRGAFAHVKVVREWGGVLRQLGWQRMDGRISWRQQATHPLLRVDFMVPVGLLKKSSVLPRVRWPSLPRLTLGALTASSSSANWLYAKREAAADVFSASFFSWGVCRKTSRLHTEVHRSRPTVAAIWILVAWTVVQPSGNAAADATHCSCCFWWVVECFKG